jgi:hypothetical protein
LSARTEHRERNSPPDRGEGTTRSDHAALIERADAWHRRVSFGQCELFGAIADIDRAGAWRDDGARDMAQWLWMRYGISDWKARRWIACAHALEGLPRIAEALATGELGVDKVVELTRFATVEREADLVTWARSVSSGRIRHRADVECRRALEEARDAEETRSVSWWYFDEGKRFGMQAELPAAQGAVVARALERAADEIPAMPGEEDASFGPQRRADALVALCSAGLAEEKGPDRATVVVHASLDSLVSGDRGCEIGADGVIHAETARRLLCDGRLQVVVEDAGGDPVAVQATRRDPPAWMVRHLRYRDRECRFPGCGSRRFTQAHHIVWWRHGGRTDLHNLVLLCTFHHKLVHEYGWSLRRDAHGTVHWFRPDGTRYRAGPGPPPPDSHSERPNPDRPEEERPDRAGQLAVAQPTLMTAAS